jgi:signal transduction histidine kinase
VAQNAERHGHDPAFQESAMRTVTDTATKMTSLMSKLSLSSVNPALNGTPESVDIPALIEEIVAPMRGVERVRLHVTGASVQPVIAVRDQMHQVFLNVILNAKQAIGQEGDISIGIEESGGSIMVTVADTGCGIPSSMLESLFQPSQSSRPGGLGVGLYQCKQMVEAHRGTIEIRSQQGQGTQVKIELPLSRLKRDGRERREKRDLRFGVRRSENFESITANPCLSLVAPFPPVSQAARPPERT